MVIVENISSIKVQSVINHCEPDKLLWVSSACGHSAFDTVPRLAANSSADIIGSWIDRSQHQITSFKVYEVNNATWCRFPTQFLLHVVLTVPTLCSLNLFLVATFTLHCELLDEVLL